MRGLGVTTALAGAVPNALVAPLVALTQLGDVWFLTAFVAAAYWLGSDRLFADRRDGARLVAVALVAFAATLALKTALALPRPPAPVALVHATGYGFPSGHATGSAAVYVGCALLATHRSRRLRLALAGGLVAVVSLTRLALGVHYLLDVAVGSALGVGVALTVLALTRDRARVDRGLWAAVAVAGAGLVASGASADAVALAGLSLGGTLAWTLVVRSGRPLGRPSLPLAAVGFVVVGGLAVAALSLGTMPVVVAISGGGAGAGLLALPASRAQNVSR